MSLGETLGRLRSWAAPRYQWIFTEPCGCPVAVIAGSAVRTAEEAMAEMYPDVAAAQASGITVRLISHEEYLREYQPKMGWSYRCPHRK